MWAKVEGASITEIIPRPKAMTVGDTQYPRNIFDLWGAAELKGIGIYPITMDNTNWKATDYYTNTGISYSSITIIICIFPICIIQSNWINS